MKIAKSFAVAFVSFIVLDFLWLGFVVKDFNLAQLSSIGRIENGDFRINYPAAAMAYVFMALAVAFFVRPHDTGSYVRTFLRGAFLGLIAYGIYDMTNLAILRDYPFAFVAADMAWGTFVFGVVSVITKRA